MSVLSKKKTPISRLQEICAHNGVEPEYQLLSVEGVVHAPTFIHRVRVAEYTATASGQSKKKSKHAAAKAMIEELIDKSEYTIENADQLLEVINEKMEKCDIKDDGSCDGGGGGDEGDDDNDLNPVGKLQEICMKKRWRPPVYSTTDEKGLPHEREFSMDCYIENMNFREYGFGKSKRMAKRQAAVKMLKTLNKENLTEADDSNEKKAKPGEPTIFESWVQSKLSTERHLFIPAKEKIENFYANLKNTPLNEINDRIKECLESNNDYDIVTAFGKLSELINCTFKFITVPELSVNGDYQSLVQLYCKEKTYSNFPVLTAFGSGETTDEAKQSAAFKAFQLFNVLIKIPTLIVEDD